MLAGCIHATASFPCQLAGPLIWTQCEPFHLTTARDSVRQGCFTIALQGAHLAMTTSLAAHVALPRCLKVVAAASTACSLNGPACWSEDWARHSSRREPLPC